MANNRTAFKDTVGGEIVLQKQRTQQQMLRIRIDSERYAKLEMLCEMMEVGDRLFEFTVNPKRTSSNYAAKGVVLVRKDVCRAGIVFKWRENDQYYKDLQRPASEEEIARAFGAKWEEIKATLPLAVVDYVYFESSPDAFFEGKGYAVYKIMMGETELERVAAR